MLLMRPNSKLRTTRYVLLLNHHGFATLAKGDADSNIGGILSVGVVHSMHCGHGDENSVPSVQLRVLISDADLCAALHQYKYFLHIFMVVGLKRIACGKQGSVDHLHAAFNEVSCLNQNLFEYSGSSGRSWLAGM